MLPPSSCSSTSTASSWTRSTSAGAAGSQRATRLGARSARSSTISRALDASRTRASGRFAARGAHFTHSKVMCWVAFDRARRSRSRSGASRARSTGGAPSRRDPRRHLRERLRRDAEHLRAVLRLDATSTRACSCCRSSASFRPTTHGSSAPSRPSSAPDEGRPRPALPTRRRASTGCPTARARSSPARSGSPTRSWYSGRVDEARQLFDRILPPQWVEIAFLCATDAPCRACLLA